MELRSVAGSTTTVETFSVGFRTTQNWATLVAFGNVASLKVRSDGWRMGESEGGWERVREGGKE